MVFILRFVRLDCSLVLIYASRVECLPQKTKNIPWFINVKMRREIYGWLPRNVFVIDGQFSESRLETKKQFDTLGVTQKHPVFQRKIHYWYLLTAKINISEGFLSYDFSIGWVPAVIIHGLRLHLNGNSGIWNREQAEKEKKRSLQQQPVFFF